LQITHQPEWHTYWKNPGDSGLPTVLEWTLPAGVTAGEIAWPTPKKIPIGNLANYGYEGTVLLPVPLTVAPGFKDEQLSVRLKASWLVCRRECIPQEGEFVLNVPARSSYASQGAAFEAARKASPQALKGGSGQATPEDKNVRVSVTGLPSNMHGKALEFFPETTGVTEPAGVITQGWQGGVWTAQVPLSALRSESPTQLPVVLALANGSQGAQSWRIELPVQGNWPAVAPMAAVSPALEAALKANLNQATPAPLGAWLLALLGALVGGLILNLMPCVFPVLAIKMVGFVQVKDPAARLRSGAAYTAGVVLSFLALGGLLLVLRAAGEQLHRRRQRGERLLEATRGRQRGEIGIERPLERRDVAGGLDHPGDGGRLPFDRFVAGLEAANRLGERLGCAHPTILAAGGERVLRAGERLRPRRQARVERGGQRRLDRAATLIEQLADSRRCGPLQRHPGLLLRLEQPGRAATECLAEPGHGQRCAVTGAKRLKPTGQRGAGRVVYLRKQRLLMAVDHELQDHQHHRQRECRGGRVKGRAKAGDHARDVVELRRRQAGDRLRDTDDRAEKAHDRDRPDHEPHQAVALPRPRGIEIGEVFEMVLEALGRAGADDEIEGLAEPTPCAS
jgi:DsbC/DsbD-like thiol-disulfide interchange protein